MGRKNKKGKKPVRFVSPPRRRRRAVTPLTTITTTTITFNLSSFHSPPRLFPSINLFRLWKGLPLQHWSLLLQLLIINILAMTLPGLIFTSEKMSNIPVHRAYWALLRHYPSLRRGSLDSSSSSLDDFSGLQRRRLSASSLDDDSPTQRRVSDSSLDDLPALLEPPARRPKMISSQSEQRLLAAEIDTPETSAPSTP